MRNEIRTANQVRKASQVFAGAMIIAADRHTNSFGAVFVSSPAQSVGDFIQRLFPAYPLPFILASFTGSLQGIVQTIRVIQDFRGSERPGTPLESF